MLRRDDSKEQNDRLSRAEVTSGASVMRLFHVAGGIGFVVGCAFPFLGRAVVSRSSVLTTVDLVAASLILVSTPLCALWQLRYDASRTVAKTHTQLGVGVTLALGAVLGGLLFVIHPKALGGCAMAIGFWLMFLAGSIAFLTPLVILLLWERRRNTQRRGRGNDRANRPEATSNTSVMRLLRVAGVVGFAVGLTFPLLGRAIVSRSSVLTTLDLVAALLILVSTPLVALWQMRIDTLRNVPKSHTQLGVGLTLALGAVFAGVLFVLHPKALGGYAMSIGVGLMYLAGSFAFLTPLVVLLLRERRNARKP